MIERIISAGPLGRALGLVVLLVGTLAAIIALPHLAIDRSDDRLISETDPGWSPYQQMQSDFGAEQSVVIFLRTRDLWTPERLKELQQLTFALEDTPGITSVSSLLSATNIRDKGEFVDAGPLLTIVPKDTTELAKLRDDALYSPLMKRTVISLDGYSTAVALSYARKPEDPDHELKIFALIEERIAPLRQHFDAVFQIGRPRLIVEIGTGMARDLKVLLPGAFAVLIAVILFFLRSARVLPIPIVTSVLTVTWTLGFMAVSGIPITLLTAMVPALIVVVGAVEDVHMITAYCEGLDQGADNPRELAIQHMARHLGLPLLITALTTFVGFMANVITEIPLIFEFALASGFAMVANFIVTILAVPLMLRWIGPRVNQLKRTDGVPAGVVGVLVRSIEFITERWPRTVLFVAAVVVAFFSAEALKIGVNNDPLSYFPSKHPFVRDATTVHNELAGLQVFSVILSARTPEAFKTAAGLKSIAAAQSVIDEQGIYDKTLSLANLLALMNQEFHASNKAFNKIPDDPEDLRLFLATLTKDDRKPFVTPDFTTARIMVRHNVINSILLNDAVDELMRVLPHVVGPGISVTFTGKNLMVNRAAASLIAGELQSLLLVIGVVFVVFTILYTSWLAGLLALVPNLVPLALNFGTMGLLGVPLNPGTAMVAAIAIGIGVDDTIHLMTRFGKESRIQLNEQSAVRETIRGEAVPVISTSVALALGFGVLGLSSFNITAQFGLLAAATMIYAALSELLLTPILLKHLRLATVWDIIAVRLDRRVLVNCPLFRNMSEYAVRKVIVLSSIQRFAAGEVVIEQGTVSHGMYVVLEGHANVSVQDKDRKLKIDEVNVGDVIGEVGFSGEEVERTATVTATRSLTVVRLDAESTRKGLRFYPSIAARLQRNISNVLGTRLLESHRRLLSAVRAERDYTPSEISD